MQSQGSASLHGAVDERVEDSDCEHAEEEAAAVNSVENQLRFERNESCAEKTNTLVRIRHIRFSLRCRACRVNLKVRVIVVIIIIVVRALWVVNAERE